MQGGNRVPFIVKWPGVCRSRESLVTLCWSAPVDVLATVADIVGRPLPAGAGEDSVSFLPLLRQPWERHSNVAARWCSSRERRSLFGTAAGNSASRRDRAASAPRRRARRAEKGLPAVQLFDVKADPAENSNLQAAHPDIVRRLTTVLERYRKTGRSRRTRGRAILRVAAVVAATAGFSFAQPAHPHPRPADRRRHGSTRAPRGSSGRNGRRKRSRARRSRQLKIRPGQTVADIGAGSGYYTVRLAEAVGPPAA